MSFRTIPPAYLALFLSMFLTGTGPGTVTVPGPGESGSDGPYAITVTAGAFEREGTVVSFRLPDPVAPGVYTMTGPDGTVTLQVDRRNTGWFVLDHLAAGGSRTWHLNPAPASSTRTPAGVAYAVDRRTITFKARGRPVLSYYHATNDPPETTGDVYERGGYLHPVYSPDGIPLTNHLDPAVHPHHYGIWSAWTHTEFQGRTPDFWNVQDRSGRVDHADSLRAAWQGPVQGGLQADNRYVDLSGPAPVVALNERWLLRVYDSPAGGSCHLFDLEITHSANTGQPLLLPQYRYGGLAVRGHVDWDDPGRVSFLTSEGHQRSDGNATRARWTAIHGTVDGNPAGLAVLGDPGNFRAPQPVRIHPDIPYFVYTPQQLGEMAIHPGSPYVMRYRIVTFDGNPDPEKLDRLWNDYAYPPGVSVVAR